MGPHEASARVEPGPMGAVALLERYRAVRRATEELVEPLSEEDCVVQSMPDVSPTKWHLAHTSWFFETFVLNPANKEYPVFHPDFGFLFNSYYDAVGPRHERPKRGLLSRPSFAEVRRYREHVDTHMEALLEGSGTLGADLAAVIDVGLHHEQQHQELILTDIKHVLSCNPLEPVYSARPSQRGVRVAELRFLPMPSGLHEFGAPGEGFAFDNERPVHQSFVQPYELSDRLVTNAEFLAFIQAGGYTSPRWWLSDGWAAVQREGWTAPLYWHQDSGRWSAFTLAGRAPLDLNEPVCHISYYEADAFARWAGARLATEYEWELAARKLPVRGNFVESGALHPRPPPGGSAGLEQMFGDVWEWTASPYTPYPGYHAPEGALGEYNGKFMCNQMVLRGGSCATPASHIRATYRNFFPPDARWQFTGVRLAR